MLRIEKHYLNILDNNELSLITAPHVFGITVTTITTTTTIIIYFTLGNHDPEGGLNIMKYGKLLLRKNITRVALLHSALRYGMVWYTRV